MNKPKKILILTSQLGGGHISIANAIKEYIQQDNSIHQVKIINLSPNISSTTYRIVGEYFVNFHEKNWQATNNPKNAKLLHLLNSPILIPRISIAIKTFKPDLIISTNAFTIHQVKSALNLQQLVIPYAVVIADPFTIHHAWTTHKNADHYLAPTPSSRKTLIKRNINPKKVTVTGLPLRLPVFNPPITQSQARKILNLDPKKITVFIGGSGEGHGHIYRITKKLVIHPKIKSISQFLVVSGKNKLLKSRLNALAKKNPHLKPFGYTKLVDTLLIASDFVVGKPGPNILFESLMLKKPFITTHQPLTQERGNYQYIKKQNLGLVTYKSSQTVKEVIKLILNPHLLDQFAPGIKKHLNKYRHTPQKTLRILQDLIT